MALIWQDKSSAISIDRCQTMANAVRQDKQWAIDTFLLSNSGEQLRQSHWPAVRRAENRRCDPKVTAIWSQQYAHYTLL